MSNIIFKTLLLKGEAGNNIQSIEKTATSGFVDTYTITLTDGSTSTFEVTNGKNSNDANLATVEDTDYASRRYAVGDFMIYQDKYYKVNQEITAGELISTNKLRITDVGTQLKDLEKDQDNNDKNFRALVSLMYYNNTGTTADKNYRAGERFILADRLREALADITAGDTFFMNLNIKTIDIYELPKLDTFGLPAIQPLIPYKKLWTNPDPTVSFGSTTLSLDLSEYDFIDIYCNLTTTSSNTLYQRILKGSAGKFINVITSTSTSYLVATTRGVGVSTDMVTIGACVYQRSNAVGSENNNSLIPIEIYGGKYPL